MVIANVHITLNMEHIYAPFIASPLHYVSRDTRCYTDDSADGIKAVTYSCHVNKYNIKAWLLLTLCRSYLKPYCMGRKTAFFQRAFTVIYILQQEHFRAFRPAWDI
jgi:hypothetical protein